MAAPQRFPPIWVFTQDYGRSLLCPTEKHRTTIKQISQDANFIITQEHLTYYIEAWCHGSACCDKLELRPDGKWDTYAGEEMR